MPYPINNKCNFNCSFCDRQWVDPASISMDDILRDAPLSELSGLRAVLGGGEPTLHPKLPAILKGLKEQKVRKIGIRTNAAWASKANLVQLLKKNGLTDAVVIFPTLDQQLFDRLVGKKQAYQTVVEGIRNLQEQKIDIILRIPILKPTLKDLPSMLEALPQVFGEIKRVDLVYLDLKDPALQVPFDAINRIFPFGSQHPNRALPPIYLDPGPGVPMCWIDKMKEWKITPDCPTSGGRKTDKCASCFISHSCPGIPNGHAALFGDEGFQPFISPIQEAYQGETNFSPLDNLNLEKKKGLTYECLDGEQTTVASMRLRVGHECNRRCEFCFIPHHEKSVQDYDIEKSIEAAVSIGVRELVMTGGEPTLQNELPVYIQKASDLGVRRIILQTNGMRLANEEYCQKLVNAGLTAVIISLHSHLDEVLSSITRRPKTLHRILQGIANLHAAGIQINITHVIGPRNYHLMPEFARFMIEEAKINRFCFIFATPMAWQMARKDIVVRYSDAAPYLMKAMDFCIEKGALVDGLAFKCGAPHCIVKGEPKYLVDAELVPDNNRSEDWVRVPACQQCVLKKQCYGVRRLYAWLYGVDEFKPVLDEKKSVEHWSPQANIPHTERDSFLSHKVTPKRYAQNKVVAQLQVLAKRQAISEDKMDRFLSSFQILPLVDSATRDPSLEHEATGYQIVHEYLGAQPINIGAASPQGTVEQAKQQAVLRSLRSLALGFPIAGAHTILPSAESSLENLAGMLHQEQVSLVTPHTSFMPSPMDAPRLKTLRHTSFCQQHKLQMSSVDSVVSLAKIALEYLQLERPHIRYGVWGFGRAGKSFTRKFDLISVHNATQQLIRPKLIGCADSKSAWIDSNGVDHERISSFKLRNGRLPQGSNDKPEQLLFTPMDLLILSGKGEPFPLEDVERIQARLIIDMTGSLDPDTEAALNARNIFCIPSVIATSGPFLLSMLELALKYPELYPRKELPESKSTIRKSFQAYLDRELGCLFQKLLEIADKQKLSMLDSFLYLVLENWKTVTEKEESLAPPKELL